MNVMEEKKALRKKMLALREGLTGEQVMLASRECLKKIMSFPAYRASNWIYCYLSFRNELDTVSMIHTFLAEGKRLAVPRIEGKEMHFYEIHSLRDCRPGTMGILEPHLGTSPDQKSKRVTETGFMLMPGLAFDLKCHRLGFGGGFYDRYLAAHPDLTTAAVCYDFQIIDHVPHGAHDLCPDVLISDRRVIKKPA